MTVNARHRRTRAPKYTKLAIGAAAAGTMVLVPSVANADPQPTIAQVNDQLNTLYQKAAHADEAYNAAQDAEAKLQQQVDGINREITAEQATMTQTKSRLGSLAAAQYRSGGIDPTLQLLMQSDPSTMLNMSATVGRVQADNAGTLGLLAQQKADLAAKAREAADKMALLDQQTKSAEATKKEFDGDVAKAQALLNSLQAQQRAALKAEQERQQAAALAAAQAASQHSTTTTTSSGSGSGSGSGTTTNGGGTKVTIPSVSGRAAAAVAFAQSQLGKPYIFGATGPGGYDCSGLSQAAWKAAGVEIPRTATAQMQGLPAIPASSAQPGDLAFFYGNSSYVDHVGIYIGNGMLIHAPHPGSSVEVVAVSSMPLVSYARP
ncbi:C40 family peptidase [Catenulispora rubra]|uniref:C40 family peptidase n=1 Tax=Catenulispora rubra TaxID=280293 RepID=UPI0018922776|nr:C40 family peptidase [Catenulispora rubra]